MAILTYSRQHARKDSRKVYIAKTSHFNKFIIMKMQTQCCSADGKISVVYYIYRHEFHKSMSPLTSQTNNAIHVWHVITKKDEVKL